MAQLDIRDIAHALSLICRGNGQVKSFFSVGQHCINAAKEASARGYSNRVILACLLHDAGESYLSDVPRPLKPSMPEYVRTEEHLLDLIYEKYLGSKLDEEEQKLVKSIDNDLLYYDLKELLKDLNKYHLPKLIFSVILLIAYFIYDSKVNYGTDMFFFLVVIGIIILWVHD